MCEEVLQMSVQETDDTMEELDQRIEHTEMQMAKYIQQGAQPD